MQSIVLNLSIVIALVLFVGETCILCAEITIPYNQYSASPTIGGPAMKEFFIQKAENYTASVGQPVIFKPDNVSRDVNALRPGVQLAMANGTFMDPLWGFLYNSMPFAMPFEEMIDFLYEGGGIDLAQNTLDQLGGSQVVFPVVGSTSQGSGYYPQPIGKPLCNEGDDACEAFGDGIGLDGLCTSGWTIRKLNAPGDVLKVACEILVEQGVITDIDLDLFPPTGGVSVIEPMQQRQIEGFEFITPYDDLEEFFPVKDGGPGSGNLDCELTDDCTQNIGQIGSRYAHYPGWHQPFLLSWMHVDKDVWEGLNSETQHAILRAARESVVESYAATDSVQCKKLQEMLDFNAGMNVLNQNGTKSNPLTSAMMTMVPWPSNDLDILRNATSIHLDSLAKQSSDFDLIYNSMKNYATQDIPLDPDKLVPFPATVGLLPGEECLLAPVSSS